MIRRLLVETAQIPAKTTSLSVPMVSVRRQQELAIPSTLLLAVVLRTLPLFIPVGMASSIPRPSIRVLGQPMTPAKAAR